MSLLALVKMWTELPGTGILRNEAQEGTKTDRAQGKNPFTLVGS